MRPLKLCNKIHLSVKGGEAGRRPAFGRQLLRSEETQQEVLDFVFTRSYVYG